MAATTIRPSRTSSAAAAARITASSVAPVGAGYEGRCAACSSPAARTVWSGGGR